MAESDDLLTPRGISLPEKESVPSPSAPRKDIRLPPLATTSTPESAQVPEDTGKAAPPQNEQPAKADTPAATPPTPIRKRRRIERLFNRTNTALTMVASIVAIFVAYPSLKPWFEPLFASWFAPALPKRQDSTQFTVAIAHLAHDNQEQHERLLIEELKALNIEILPLGRTIHLNATLQAEQQREERGHAEARQYLAATGADALIWGYVHTIDGKSAPRFYWTTAQAGRRSKEAYAPEQFHLPDLFWEDVVVVLRLLLTSTDGQFIAQSGQFLGDRLAPFIDKTRQLLANATPGKRGWTAEGIASVQVILVNALNTFGEQSGNKALLDEAVTAYRAALLEFTREKVPLQWARTQNNLGTALRILGERQQQASVGRQALESHVAAWEVYTGNAEYYATMARNNMQDDVALLRGKLASPEAQGCLARYEAVLQRMGVETFSPGAEAPG